MQWTTAQFRGMWAYAAICTSLTIGATVTVDPAIRYQTIDGFGSSPGREWQNNCQDHCDRIVNDLGMSLMRNMMKPEFEESNDNNDPCTAGSFSTTAEQVVVQRQLLEKLYNAGLRNVCLSTFSPPAWMKTNGSLIEGGELRADMYDEFAEYYCEYIRFVESTGLKVTAVSPQNEPGFALWYNSCVYSPEQMRDIVITLGQRFESEGIDTRIMWAEEVFSQPWQPYAGYVFADPTAKQYGDIIAIHHQDFHAEATWTPAYESARRQLDNAVGGPTSAVFWNSEISGFREGWDGAIEMAKGFVISLRDGRMSALLYGSASAPSNKPHVEALMVEREPTERYYAARQFYRYIRPGAVMIDAVADDPDIMAVASVHESEQTLTIVLVNHGPNPKNVDLNGVGTQSYTQIRSTASEECREIGAVSTTCTLPAQSVTTLVARDYATSSAPRLRPMRSVQVSADMGPLMLLNGRYLVVGKPAKATVRVLPAWPR